MSSDAKNNGSENGVVNKRVLAVYSDAEQNAKPKSPKSSVLEKLNIFNKNSVEQSTKNIEHDPSPEIKDSPSPEAFSATSVSSISDTKDKSR